jgi:peptidoglycan/LPS O-acetylase OafA/YrhL
MAESNQGTSNSPGLRQGLSGRGSSHVNGECVLSFESFRNAKHFPALDGIRALCALLIVRGHMKMADWDFLPGVEAVMMFFILSGFLVTTLALREESSKGQVSLLPFYIRRIFRIVPVYAVVLAIYCILVLAMGGEAREEFMPALPYFATYLNEFAPNVAEVPFAQSWCLGILMKFYLAWPVLGFIILKRSTWGRFALLATLTALHFLFFAGFSADIGRSGISPALLSKCYMYIAVGCLAAACLNEPAIYRHLRSLGRTGASWILAGLLVATVYVRAIEALYPFAAALFLVSIVVGPGPISSLLGSKPLMFLGERSYGIYLIHVIALRIVERILQPLSGSTAAAIASYVFAVILSVAMAEALHRTVERPAIGLGRRLLKKAGNPKKT